jgi:hypothetical protein
MRAGPLGAIATCLFVVMSARAQPVLSFSKDTLLEHDYPDWGSADLIDLRNASEAEITVDSIYLTAMLDSTGTCSGCYDSLEIYGYVFGSGGAYLTRITPGWQSFRRPYDYYDHDELLTIPAGSSVQLRELRIPDAAKILGVLRKQHDYRCECFVPGDEPDTLSVRVFAWAGVDSASFVLTGVLDCGYGTGVSVRRPAQHAEHSPTPPVARDLLGRVAGEATGVVVVPDGARVRPAVR